MVDNWATNAHMRPDDMHANIWNTFQQVAWEQRDAHGMWSAQLHSTRQSAVDS